MGYGLEVDNINNNSTDPGITSPTLKFVSKLKKFKGKPSIVDEPHLVDLCEYYLSTKNITGLSLIARQRGLPPHLRHKIWPLLLRTHPFLIKPYITPDEEIENDNYDDQDVKQKIKHDLKRYFKRSRNHIDVNDLKNNNNEDEKAKSVETQELLKFEDEIIKVMQYSIWKFLKKWGSLINYNSGLTWIALGLAEWVPPLLTNENESSNYVLCGREFVNKNGDTCLRNINNELNEYYSSFSIYKRQCDSDDSSAISVSTFTTNTTQLSSQQPPSPSPPQTTSSKQSTPLNNKNLSFAEIYERMVLVILHSPEPSEDSSSESPKPKKNEEEDEDEDEDDDEEEEASLKLKILTTLPVRGGTAEERISFFLYCLRRLLPELAQFFIDEDILNTTSVKDDWVVWWLKWCGAKVWSKYDRGRIWDMLLGWRCFDEFLNKDELNELLMDDTTVNALGPDIFWHPLTFDNEDKVILDDYDDLQNRRDSIKTLISSLSNTNLSSLSSSPSSNNTKEKFKDIPFAHLDPHTEIVFMSLSFIKSKEFALLELEQSEIREFLNKASSTKLYGFQNLFEDEMNESNTNGNSNNKMEDSNEISNEFQLDEHVTTTSTRTKKNELRDIENIIIESGELWRKWIWQEVSD